LFRTFTDVLASMQRASTIRFQVLCLTFASIAASPDAFALVQVGAKAQVRVMRIEGDGDHQPWLQAHESLPHELSEIMPDASGATRLLVSGGEGVPADPHGSELSVDEEPHKGETENVLDIIQMKSGTAFNCARDPGAIVDPSPEQAMQSPRGTTTSLEMILAKVAMFVDVAYILCTRCNELVLPVTAPLVKLVSAPASDACFQRMGAVPNASECEQHLIRITFAHKAAVAHALINGFSNILVLEEDVEVHKSPDFTGVMRQVRSLQTKLGPKLVRFTMFPWQTVLQNGTCSSTECRCRSVPADSPKQDTSRFCILPPGCTSVQDSSMYALPRSLFLDFIHAGGVVDHKLFASFESVLVLNPVLVVQTHSGSLCRNTSFNADQQLALVDSYIEACMEHAE